MFIIVFSVYRIRDVLWVHDILGSYGYYTTYILNQWCPMEFLTITMPPPPPPDNRGNLADN